MLFVTVYTKPAVVATRGFPSDPVYVCPPTLSVTLTLNWYCCPLSSPDTTPEEMLAGKVADPESICLLLLTILL